MPKRKAPEVNAGSMADIAFLLLIFFLVTSEMSKESGMFQLLPILCSKPDGLPELRSLFSSLAHGSLQVPV